MYAHKPSTSTETERFYPGGPHRWREVYLSSRAGWFARPSNSCACAY